MINKKLIILSNHYRLTEYTYISIISRKKELRNLIDVRHKLNLTASSSQYSALCKTRIQNHFRLTGSNLLIISIKFQDQKGNSIKSKIPFSFPAFQGESK